MPVIKNTIDRNDKEKYSYQRMLSFGWSPVQAAAIVGNLKHESGFGTGAEGDKGYKGGSSFGLAQWREGRLTNLKKKYGDKWTDLDNQLDYVNYELNTTHKKAGDALRKSKSIYDAGRIVSDNYEVPSVKFNANDQRQNAVFDIYRKYTGLKLSPQDELAMASRQVKRGMDSANYQSNETITPKLTNFAIPTNNTTFTEVSPQTKVEEQEDEEDTVQAKAELYQKQNEEDFFNNYLNTQQTAPKTEEYEPTYEEVAQQDPYDVTTPYNQIEQFVEMQEGGFIKDNMGQWKYPGYKTEISSPNISMKDVNYNVLGISKQTGEMKLMRPNQNYYFSNTEDVLEIPQLQKYLK